VKGGMRVGKSRRRWRSDDFNDDEFDEEASSGSDLGGYARVATKEADRDGEGGGGGGGGAFV